MALIRFTEVLNFPVDCLMDVSQPRIRAGSMDLQWGRFMNSFKRSNNASELYAWNILPSHCIAACVKQFLFCSQTHKTWAFYLLLINHGSRRSCVLKNACRYPHIPGGLHRVLLTRQSSSFVFSWHKSAAVPQGVKPAIRRARVRILLSAK